MSYVYYEGLYDYDPEEMPEVINSWEEFSDQWGPEVATLYKQQEEDWLNYEAGLESPDEGNY